MLRQKMSMNLKEPHLLMRVHGVNMPHAHLSAYRSGRAIPAKTCLPYFTGIVHLQNSSVGLQFHTTILVW